MFLKASASWNHGGEAALGEIQIRRNASQSRAGMDKRSSVFSSDHLISYQSLLESALLEGMR